MLQMDKLDIEKLKQAYERGSVEVDGKKSITVSNSISVPLDKVLN